MAPKQSKFVGHQDDFIILDSDNNPTLVHVYPNKDKRTFVDTVLDGFMDKGLLDDVDESEGPNKQTAFSFHIRDAKLLRRIATLLKGRAKVEVDLDD